MDSFLSVSHALRWAHSTEATPILQQSGSMAGGGSPPGPKDLTPHERHAQAAFIIKAVEETLDRDGYAFLRAYYMPPGDDKQVYANRVVRMTLDYIAKPSMDPEWVECQVLEWIGQGKEYRIPSWWEGPGIPTDSQWATFLGKSNGLLSQWRNGDKNHPGLIPGLEGVLDRLKGRLAEELRDRGFILDREAFA